MTGGDFFGSEQSVTVDAAKDLRIEHVAADGTVTVLKQGLKMTAGEVCDSTRMSVRALQDFFEREMAECKEQDILLSLHLKATMMKVSDPIMFGHCVKVFFKDLFAKHGALFAELGVNPNNGFGDVVGKIGKLPEEKRKEVEADIEACYASRPKLAMVNSNRGITNLHVPSDVIIDASMPSMIRGMDGLGGGMWCPDSAPGAKDSHLVDTKALIPDRCYAGVFKEAVAFCKANGAFDPATMGSVPNVGLMALKAEEYGSHPNTFEAPSDGKMRVVTEAGETLMEHDVETGDIWRACQTKDIAIKDWVKLAVTRGRACGWPVIFWLDANRAHDAQIIAKVNAYLPEHDTSGLQIDIMEPAAACRFSLERAKRGESTISVTGNVLRDYNTDLFPILELGTSAKMLSIVPLLAGGGMYETGAGGSAPKHVEQFQQEGHLRWDSLGEFLALAVSLEEIGVKKENDKVKALAAALNAANEQFLDANKNPSRKVKEIDNRGSHFYLALYWAQNLAAGSNAELAARFGPIAAGLTEAEGKINQELIDCQGEAVDFGGYFKPVDDLAFAAMRPSATLNAIIDSMA
jgi:isocitrate dehydrogenase